VCCCGRLSPPPVGAGSWWLSGGGWGLGVSFLGCGGVLGAASRFGLLVLLVAGGVFCTLVGVWVGGGGFFGIHRCPIELSFSS